MLFPLLLSVMPLTAQDAPGATAGPSPSDSANTVAATESSTASNPHLHFAFFPTNLANSPLFAPLVDTFTDGNGAELERLIDRYRDVVGIDPRTDIRRLDGISSGQLLMLLENDLKGLLLKAHATVEVKSLGNLPGIMLAYPGYGTTKQHKAGVLHTLRIEEAAPTLLVWQTEKGAPRRVVASFDEEILNEAIEADGAPRPRDLPGEQTMLATFALRRPAYKTLLERFASVQESGESIDPEAAVVVRVLERLQELDLTVTHDPQENSIDTNLRFHANDEIAAGQIEKLLKAALAFVATNLEASEMAERFEGVLEKVEVKSQDTTVHCQFSSQEMHDYQALISLLGEVLKF